MVGACSTLQDEKQRQDSGGIRCRLTLVDAQLKRTVENGKLFKEGDWSPYVYGINRMAGSIVHGQTVFVDGQIHRFVVKKFSLWKTDSFPYKELP